MKTTHQNTTTTTQEDDSQHTSNNRHTSNDHLHITIAKSYYRAMLEKDFDKMASYLDDAVQIISPLSTVHGKNDVVHAAKNFAALLQDVQIRSEFSSDNQIMFAYDMILPEPIDRLRSALLMSFNDQLINKIELFYDARPLIEKGKEIFS